MQAARLAKWEGTMLNNAALDIAIGLVLMFLVLSLMGTVVNEYISTLMKLRASILKNAIENLLDNPALRADFYNHGLIDGTKQATGDHPSYFSGQTFAMAVVGSIDAAKTVPSFADVKTAVENMPDCNIRDVLLTQLTKANGDLDKLRNGIASYFDASMDRVSGIYKRYLKWISLGVGLVIVLALNADSIKVGSALWSDSSLRAQMVQSANDFLNNNVQPPAPTADANAAVTAESTTAFADRLDTLNATIRPLPIGWKASDFFSPLSWNGLESWLMKFFGLAITALAISLGAPFWFDMLSKLMNIRGTGIKPESTTSG
jgi:hypothetical protein